MSKRRVVLIFPDGVGIRNYLYSDVFKNTDAELVVLHNFDEATELLLSELTTINQFIKLPTYQESFNEKFLRELICLCRLKYNAEKVQNSNILTNWRTDYKDLAKKVFYKLIAKISSRVTDYNSIIKFEQAYQRSLRKNGFYNQIDSLISSLKPDLVFCAHQRGIQCATVFAVAKDRNIPSSTVIFSWDNLPKARLALQADTYLVWSDYMKEEIKIYYPEIPADRVVVTGTPQFEFYNNAENIIAKEDFFKKYNLDHDKKIICFSGDDIKTSPDDPKYLYDLASELIKNDMQNDYQILLRRCPVDISDRFHQVVNQFPDLIKEAAPIWYFYSESSWSTIFALPEDVCLLVSTVYYSDIVINVGSTMVFDFAMFKKPCIFIAYNQEVKADQSWSVDIIYSFQHFRSMPNDSAVLWWKKKDEISNLIKLAEYNQYTDIWTDRILGDYRHSSQRINNALKL